MMSMGTASMVQKQKKSALSHTTIFWTVRCSTRSQSCRPLRSQAAGYHWIVYRSVPHVCLKQVRSKCRHEQSFNNVLATSPTPSLAGKIPCFSDANIDVNPNSMSVEWPESVLCPET